MQRRKEKQPSDQTIAVFSNVTPWVLQYKKMWGSCFSCTATSHIFVLDYVTIKELLSKFLTRQQAFKVYPKWQLLPIIPFLHISHVLQSFIYMLWCIAFILRDLTGNPAPHTHTLPLQMANYMKTQSAEDIAALVCVSASYIHLSCATIYHFANTKSCF